MPSYKTQGCYKASDGNEKRYRWEQLTKEISCDMMTTSGYFINIRLNIPFKNHEPKMIDLSRQSLIELCFLGLVSKYQDLLVVSQLTIISLNWLFG